MAKSLRQQMNQCDSHNKEHGPRGISGLTFTLFARHLCGVREVARDVSWGQGRLRSWQVTLLGDDLCDLTVQLSFWDT